ncbi:hypothetical protein [Streptomyces omiyaensis]|uniref:hypothetical protein n=1 Tax=Streptomyces omiyaensis TaxID=68247 RepID=UPI0036FA4C9D
MTTPRSRGPEEVFADYGERFAIGDPDLIAENDGVDTFVFRDGLTGARTAHHTLSPRTTGRPAPTH